MEDAATSTSLTLRQQSLTHHDQQQFELNHLCSILDGACEVQVFSSDSNNDNHNASAAEHSFTVSINRNRLPNKAASASVVNTAAGSKDGENDKNNNNNTAQFSSSSNNNNKHGSNGSNASHSLVVAPQEATLTSRRRCSRREGLLKQLELARGIRQRLEQSYQELSDAISLSSFQTQVTATATAESSNRRSNKSDDTTRPSNNNNDNNNAATSACGNSDGYSSDTVALSTIRDRQLAARRVLGERKSDLLQLVALTQAMNQNRNSNNQNGINSQQEQGHVVLNSYDYIAETLLQEEQDAISNIQEHQQRFKQSQSNLLKQMYKVSSNASNNAAAAANKPKQEQQHCPTHTSGTFVNIFQCNEPRTTTDSPETVLAAGTISSAAVTNEHHTGGKGARHLLQMLDHANQRTATAESSENGTSRLTDMSNAVTTTTEASSTQTVSIVTAGTSYSGKGVKHLQVLAEVKRAAEEPSTDRNYEPKPLSPAEAMAVLQTEESTAASHAQVEEGTQTDSATVPTGSPTAAAALHDAENGAGKSLHHPAVETAQGTDVPLTDKSMANQTPVEDNSSVTLDASQSAFDSAPTEPPTAASTSDNTQNDASTIGVAGPSATKRTLESGMPKALPPTVAPVATAEIRSRSSPTISIMPTQLHGDVDNMRNLDDQSALEDSQVVTTIEDSQVVTRAAAFADASAAAIAATTVATAKATATASTGANEDGKKRKADATEDDADGDHELEPPLKRAALQENMQ